MKTVGIIAEYNPFHNGHAYHIRQAKKIAHADYCIVIMSGDFVQRGAPAIMDKFLRTRAALLSGADLVIELPVSYAAASAEYFACGAVSLLDKLGVTDSLCFGSECGNLHALSILSDALAAESGKFKECLQEELKAGRSYPEARTLALSRVSGAPPDTLPLLRSPNNILGIEYLKALKMRNSAIIPYTIMRSGTDYHDSSLHSGFSSALALRGALAEKKEILTLKEHLPAAVYDMMAQNYEKCFPILPDDIGMLLPYKLMQEKETGFTKYLDIDESFSDKLRKNLFSYTDFTTFCTALKSRNMTYTRVSRSLIHILLNIYQEDMNNFRQNDYIYYARMLGFKKESAPLLSKIKANSSVPFLSRLADADSLIIQDNGRKMLAQDIWASTVYDLLVQQKFHGNLKSEYQKQIVIL